MSELRAWRIREGQGSALELEELDFATDGLWKIFAERLEQWSVFEGRAFAKLAELGEGAGEYGERVRKAERARHLSCHLLGSVGTDFTEFSYEQQAEFMTTLWAVIDNEGLEQEFASLVGEEFIHALRDCQRRYRALLAEGAGHEPFPLAARRDRLRGHIRLYIAALISGVDDRDERALAAMRQALAPVEMLRGLELHCAGGIAHEGHEELDIDPLLTALDAVDLELGIQLGDHVDHALSESSGAWQST